MRSHSKIIKPGRKDIKVPDTAKPLCSQQTGEFLRDSLPSKEIKASKTVNSAVLKAPASSNLIDSLRFSIRISRKSVSSVSLKRNIVSLWLLLTGLDTSSAYKIEIMDFIYLSLETWNKDTAKGFSDFVTERMIEDILEKKDFLEYQKIKDILGTL